MKIIGISGSPRKGNTEFMVKTCLEACKKAGAKTELVLLRERNIKGCKGCEDYCNDKGVCFIKDDDMNEINNKLVKADGFIIGSPTYFDTVPGLLKNFLDRTHPLYAPKKLKGKRVIIISVGTADEESIRKTIKYLETFCEIYEMKVLDYTWAKADGPNKVAKNKKVIKKLQNLGEKLVKSIESK